MHSILGAAILVACPTLVLSAYETCRNNTLLICPRYCCSSLFGSNFTEFCCDNCTLSVHPNERNGERCAWEAVTETSAWVTIIQFLLYVFIVGGIVFTVQFFGRRSHICFPRRVNSCHARTVSYAPTVAWQRQPLVVQQQMVIGPPAVAHQPMMAQQPMMVQQSTMPQRPMMIQGVISNPYPSQAPNEAIPAAPPPYEP